MVQMEHGGHLDAAISKYGGNRSDWLDLSTGISPILYRVPDLDPETWNRLPDHRAMERLKGAARAYYGVPENKNVVVAAGSQSLIQGIPELADKTTVAIVTPTYNEHHACWEAAGHRVVSTSSLDLPDEAKHAVVVNPNNPDCRVHSRRQLEVLATKLRKRDGLLIVDEAFVDCMPEASIVSNLPENCIVLKSFGKFFGMAGLRLGFAICGQQWAETLSDKLGPWPVSGPALEIGKQALSNTKWIENTRRKQRDLAVQLVDLLASHGLKVAGHTSLYVYVEHVASGEVSEQLGERHILVRSFSNLPNNLRFGLCKNDDELSQLDHALTEIIDETN